jgi:integrase
MARRPRRQKRQHGTGSVRRKGRGWESLITVGGQTIRTRWDHEPTAAQLLAWCVAQRAGQPAGPAAGSLEADVARYLPLISAMPTYAQVAAHLTIWLEALGRTRGRQTVTSDEITRIVQRWLVTPTRPAEGQRGRPSGARGLGAGTIRKRLNSLRMLYVRLDGKQAANPVRGVEKPRAPKPQRRGRDYPLIARILAAMPTERSHKQGAIVRPALAPIRAAVIAYTGIPPHQVAALGPTDIDLLAGTVRLPERHKGGGVEMRVLPLTPQGVEAFRAFHQANAYGGRRGTYDAASRAFKRAAERIGIDPATITLYDLRHSFGEETYRQTGDLATVGRMMGHAEGSTVTARYAMGANDAINRAAAAAFGAAVAAQQAAAQPAPQPQPHARSGPRRRTAIRLTA